MNFTSETGSLPKGFGYVLKPSAVEKALNAAGVQIDVHLVREHGQILLDAHFWPPNSRNPHERLYVRSGAAALRDLPTFRGKVELSALPRLVRWISDIVDLDPKSPIRCEEQWILLLP